MMARSHLLLAGAAYAALALHPIETPLGTLSAPALHGLHVPYAGASLDGPPALALSTAVAALSGLGPDIDKSGSAIARSVGLVTRVTAWAAQRTLGHRGPLHSAWGTLLAFVAGALLGEALGVSGLGQVVAFGWAVHLLTDAWTSRGVPLFWPLTPTRLRLPPGFATGSIGEALVLLAGLLACIWWAGTSPAPVRALAVA